MAQEAKRPVKHFGDFRLGNRLIEKNHVCCDCNAPNPKWAVTTHGILVWYVSNVRPTPTRLLGSEITLKF